jgi:hypothetical protein
MVVGGGKLGRRQRRRFVFGGCDLMCVFYHFPTPLTLPLS